MLDLNYVIGADGQKTLSATGSTIQSATITTSGSSFFDSVQKTL